MKRVLFVILSLIFVVFFVGCGTYERGSDSPSNENTVGGGTRPGGGVEEGNPNGGGTKPGDKEDDGGEYVPPEVQVYTVTLFEVQGTGDNKTEVVYTATENIQAIWTGRYGTFTEDFVNGVAKVEGLEGEYHVTLSSVPDNYTYDPNGYITNNSSRDIRIELLRLLKPGGNGGSSAYNCLLLQDEGTYRATFKSKTDIIYYEFMPTHMGVYSVTSWVDTVQNKVNPLLDVWGGSFAFKIFDRTIDKGGAASTYTKNFKQIYEFATENIGALYTFAIHVDVASGTTVNKDNPVTVDFTIKWEGEYYLDLFGDPTFSDGEHFLKRQPTGSFQYIYKDAVNNMGYDGYGNRKYLLDSSYVKLKEKDDEFGAGGYYYLYDEKKYANNGGYGPMLFAKLSKDTEVMWTIDDKGSHVNDGFNWNQLNGGMINCTIDGLDYAYMISGGKDDKGVKHEGYVNYCNSDGVHPVTEEIKNFLQGYASREFYFNDGEGWAENSKLNEILNTNGTATVKPGICLQSSEYNQWLFACGYYPSDVKK